MEPDSNATHPDTAADKTHRGDAPQKSVPPGMVLLRTAVRQAFTRFT